MEQQATKKCRASDTPIDRGILDSFADYCDVCKEMGLPNIAESSSPMRIYDFKSEKDTRGRLFELQKLAFYAKASKDFFDQYIRQNLQEQMRCAMELNDNKVIETLEGGSGFWERHVQGGSNTYFSKAGTEGDLVQSLLFARRILADVKGVHYCGIGALLYAKTEYYINFVIDGFDGEFRITIPNWDKFNCHEESYPKYSPTVNVTPCDPHISYRPFASHSIDIMAIGATVEELHDNFASALNDGTADRFINYGGADKDSTDAEIQRKIGEYKEIQQTYKERFFEERKNALAFFDEMLTKFPEVAP